MIGDWWPLWTAVLGVALTAMAAAPFAAHIPYLAPLTGAAPLDKEDPC